MSVEAPVLTRLVSGLMGAEHNVSFPKAQMISGTNRMLLCNVDGIVIRGFGVRSCRNRLLGRQRIVSKDSLGLEGRSSRCADLSSNNLSGGEHILTLPCGPVLLRPFPYFRQRYFDLDFFRAFLLTVLSSPYSNAIALSRSALHSRIEEDQTAGLGVATAKQRHQVPSLMQHRGKIVPSN